MTDNLDIRVYSETEKLLTDSESVLDRLRKGIEGIVLSVSISSSWITKASNFWCTIPMWAHALIDIILISAGVTAGVFLSFTPLITFSVFTFVIYAATTYLFNDHKQCEHDKTKELAKVMGDSAVILNKVFNSLETVCDAIGEQVTLFQNTNLQLQIKVKEFTGKINQVTKSSAAMQQNVQDIQKSIDDREATIARLEAISLEQELHLQVYPEQIQEIREQYTQASEVLSQKMVEHEQIHLQLSAALEKANSVSSQFNGCVQNFLSKLVPDVTLRDEMMSDFNSEYELRRKKVDDLSIKMIAVTNTYEQTKCQYAAGLKRYYETSNRFEALLMQSGNAEEVKILREQKQQFLKAARGIEGLKEYGFFAGENQDSNDGEQSVLEFAR